jgi:hypothetical protein
MFRELGRQADGGPDPSGPDPCGTDPGGTRPGGPGGRRPALAALLDEADRVLGRDDELTGGVTARHILAAETAVAALADVPPAGRAPGPPACRGLLRRHARAGDGRRGRLGPPPPEDQRGKRPGQRGGRAAPGSGPGLTARQGNPAGTSAWRHRRSQRRLRRCPWTPQRDRRDHADRCRADRGRVVRGGALLAARRRRRLRGPGRGRVRSRAGRGCRPGNGRLGAAARLVRTGRAAGPRLRRQAQRSAAG